MKICNSKRNNLSTDRVVCFHIIEAGTEETLSKVFVSQPIKREMPRYFPTVQFIDALEDDIQTAIIQSITQYKSVVADGISSIFCENVDHDAYITAEQFKRNALDADWSDLYSDALRFLSETLVFKNEDSDINVVVEDPIALNKEANYIVTKVVHSEGVECN